MHCMEMLFTPRSPRARKFPPFSVGFYTTYGLELLGIKVPNFHIFAYFSLNCLKCTFVCTVYNPGVLLPVNLCCSGRAKGVPFAGGFSSDVWCGSWWTPKLSIFCLWEMLVHTSISHRQNIDNIYTMLLWGLKHVIPCTDVPFGGLDDVPINYGSHTPKNNTLKHEQQKIYILTTWILLSQSWCNFYSW